MNQQTPTATKVGTTTSKAGLAMLGLLFWGFLALVMIVIGIAIVYASGPIGAATFGVLVVAFLFLLIRGARRS